MKRRDVQQSLSGDDAFERLFDEQFPALFRYLSRRIRSDRAEEIAAETFLVAYRDSQRFDPTRGSPRAWLFGIAAKKLLREHRRERRELRAYGASGVDPLGFGFEELDNRLDARESAADLAAALAELKPGDREALLLFAWAELSYAEIAVALAIPIGTVRSRINRARRQMRAALSLPDYQEDTVK